MTSWVVTDSSILLATVLTETYSDAAEALVQSWEQSGMKIAAPTLLRYELVAVIRKHVARGALTAEHGLEAREKLLSQKISFYLNSDLLRRGYELATRFNRPTAYDSQYLAVAERLGCEFWTADERLYNALHQDLTWVKWLGNFSPPQ